MPEPQPTDPTPTVDQITPSASATAEPGAVPARLGRFRIVRALGRGNFGTVYQGHDDDLRRDVALKVSHRERVATAEAIDTYLAEARVLAQLDHPGIVPVYDFGRTEDGLCYLVSKFVEGSDLKARIKQGRPSVADSADLVASVAEALHHAHQRGLVHRDIKPANILLDMVGRPVVADFGLALREEDLGQGSNFVGTQAYMSPEQARGEGHLVDARTDVYSLGVVFYELLTGQRPFQGEARQHLLEMIKTREPRPPRQLDAGIPRELDRICLKCLARRATDRYSTALDVAEDLRHFLDRPTGSSSWRQAAPPGSLPPPLLVSTHAVSALSLAAVSSARPSTAPPAATTDPDSQPLKIVPKGLRSFDAGDADFFLELLPGPRDRHGLPDSLRFWKTRIEETDADKTFRVGLLYGPSGCGKSSLVKAGLLPRLAEHVLPVYVEATAADTETRLLTGLRKRCPNLPDHLGLAETLARLRRQPLVSRNAVSGEDQKLVLVLDQFEQWLHAKRGEEHTELVQALRQCDGGRVQCLVLVRDDFWMAATRFMADLEISLVQGQNCAAVDLFNLRHAQKVLTAFGRAFGMLAEPELSKEQDLFLEQAVAGLAQEGKIISVRLALFAEMVKGKLWTPGTLHEVGGMEGVGAAFLEETFGAATAPPQHRLHQKAAQAVLKALLPETGTNIKGNLASQQDLLAASGYSHRPRDFAELVGILDQELRLITPTDPEGVDADSQPAPDSSGQYYQLTHDYLVPSLRDWLTRKQKETRRGRAELLLADRASVWNARPEKRQLPSLVQWLQIKWHTRRQNWTPAQHKMMRQAGRWHTLRGLLVAGLLVALTLTGLTIRDQLVEHQRHAYATALVQQLGNVQLDHLPDLIERMSDYRDLVEPRLHAALAEAVSQRDAHRELQVRLALLPVDESQFASVYDRLLQAGPEDLPVIRDLLKKKDQDQLVDRLRGVLGNAQDEALRLRAACALADCVAPSDACWPPVAGRLVRQFFAAVDKNPNHYSPLLTSLRPVGQNLVPTLAELYRKKQAAEAEQKFAANLLGEYAGDQPQLLADLLLDGTAAQYGILFDKLKGGGELVRQVWRAELARPLQYPWDDVPLTWPEADAASIQSIKAAHGLIHERWAFCQTMPLTDLVKVAERLRRCGYRPTRLRPYVLAGGMGFQARPEKTDGLGSPEYHPGPLGAAVWTRDGREWQLVHALTAAGVEETHKKLQAQGYQPVDVAGYRDGPQERYTALWAKAGPADPAQLYVGVPEAKHQASGWGPLRKAKLEPLTLQVFAGADGKPLYSAVWRKQTAKGTSSWDADEQALSHQALDSLLLDVNLRHSREYIREAQNECLAWLTPVPWLGLAARCQYPLLAHPERSYAATLATDASIDHSHVLGLTPEQQLRRAAQLLEQGFRPVAWSVAPFPVSGAPAAESSLLAAALWHRPVIPEEAKAQRDKRQAQAAVALLGSGQPEQVWPLLHQEPADPQRRSFLIHQFASLGSDLMALVGQLRVEQDISTRRALLLSLGEYPVANLPAAGRDTLLAQLRDWYQLEADAGLHGATGWLLRRWGEQAQLDKLDQQLVAGRDAKLAQIGQELARGATEPRWYVNRQGQTFVVLPAPEAFLMGSPRTEAGRSPDERLHRRRLGRTYALASTSVTVAQFQRFLKDNPDEERSFYDAQGQVADLLKKYNPDAECPIGLVDWYTAAHYCNWLSQQEGIRPEEWCYQPNARGDYYEGMRVVPLYWTRAGYRLPTEAEWEYACRAGAPTGRYFGESVELLRHYAWYQDSAHSRTWPVSSLKPNDWGLFDIHGDVWNWCQDAYYPYKRNRDGTDIDDTIDISIITKDNSRLLRGGAFSNRAVGVRCAYRDGIVPGYRDGGVGFRPARTLSLSSFTPLPPAR